MKTPKINQTPKHSKAFKSNLKSKLQAVFFAAALGAAAYVPDSFAGSGSPSVGTGAGNSVGNSSKVQECMAQTGIAKTIMTARQSGAPLDSLLKIVEPKADSTEINRIARRYSTGIILHAYETPAYSVKENQDKAINEFYNKYLLECMQE